MRNKHFWAAGTFAVLLLAGMISRGVSEDADYILRRSAEGKPVFTQVIHWKAQPDALEYRLRLRSADGRILVDEKLADARKEVSLAVGHYEYKITTFNLLDQEDAETDWIGFDVFKAQQPTLLSSVPRTIDLETATRQVTLTGSTLLSDGAPILVAKDGGRWKGVIVQHRSDKEIVVQFPEAAYVSGDYSIEFDNPGGLSSSLDRSLTIRPFSPEPEFWVSGVGSASLGLGTLAAWSPASFGGGSCLEIDRVLLRGGSLALEAKYDNYLLYPSSVTSLQQLDLALTLGYSLDLGHGLTLTPRLGAGYMEGYVSDNLGDRSGAQLALLGRGELAWQFLPLWRLKAAAGYRATVEEGAWYSSLSMDLGLAWQVPLEVGHSWLLR